jgi:hypothetical protein
VNRILPPVGASRRMLALNCAGLVNENRMQKLRGAWCTVGAQMVHNWHRPKRTGQRGDRFRVGTDK